MRKGGTVKSTSGRGATGRKPSANQPAGSEPPAEKTVRGRPAAKAAPGGARVTVVYWDSREARTAIGRLLPLARAGGFYVESFVRSLLEEQWPRELESVDQEAALEPVLHGLIEAPDRAAAVAALADRVVFPLAAMAQGRLKSRETAGVMLAEVLDLGYRVRAAEVGALGEISRLLVERVRANEQR